MYDRFENLEEEKRERILNAAMGEFSAKGYDHASTNAIVERAGIAKGLLFHYFKSKKQLFLYLYDYSVQKVMSGVLSSSAMEERDFFARMRVGQKAKMALLLQYPEMFKFMQMAYLEESHAIKPEMEQKNHAFLHEATGKFFLDVDKTRFKAGLDVGAAINAVLWSLEGFTNQYLHSLKTAQTAFDFDAAIAESDRYLNLFRDSFYELDRGGKQA